MSERNGILVTGGTGSLGRAVVKRLRDTYGRRARVIVYSRNEEKQWQMRRDPAYSGVTFMVGDVRDQSRLTVALLGCVAAVHCAAIKHVSTGEEAPTEAISTNIDGSSNLIAAARTVGLARVVAISTDKAVEPTSLYGATKLCAEKLFLQANPKGQRRSLGLSFPPAGKDVAPAGARRERGTDFVIVRLGNLFGSSGSIVPLLLDQRRSGQVTLTDPEMTRFYLRIEVAAQWVVSAMMTALSGETWIPLCLVARLRSLVNVLAPDCQRIVTGAMPGERLFETLISADEAPRARFMPDVYRMCAPWQSPIDITGTPEAAVGGPVTSNKGRELTEPLIRAWAEELYPEEVLCLPSR